MCVLESETHRRRRRCFHMCVKISQRPLFLKQIATVRFLNRRPTFQGLELKFHSSQLKWRGHAPSTCARSFVTLVDHVNPRRGYTTHLPLGRSYTVEDVTAAFYIKLASRLFPEHVYYIKCWGGSITCPPNDPL